MRGWMGILVGGVLALACGPTVDGDGDDSSGTGSGPGSGSGNGGSSDGNGDGIDCSSFSEASACNGAQDDGSLQACAWVEVFAYDAPGQRCDGTSQERCIEMNLSGNEGCPGWSCLGDADFNNVFVRELEDGSAEVVAGPFCGNEPLDFGTCASEDRSFACDCFCGDGLPDACRFEPTSDECRDAFSNYCEGFTAEDACGSALSLPSAGDSEIRCTWVTPTRYTLAGDVCQSTPETPRCLAGDFVGDGGAGCSPRWDPDDEGEGTLIGASPDCTSAYDWASCSIGAVPLECDCAF